MAAPPARTTAAALSSALLKARTARRLQIHPLTKDLSSRKPLDPPVRNPTDRHRKYRAGGRRLGSWLVLGVHLPGSHLIRITLTTGLLPQTPRRSFGQESWYTSGD